MIGISAFALALSIGLPVSVPPADPDPLLERMAPPSAILFGCSSGSVTARADSTNHTELLLAEPQVREFLKHLGEQLDQLVEADLRGPDERQLLIRAQPAVIRAMLARPVLAYLSEFNYEGPLKATARGAIVVRLGSLKPRFEALLKLLPDNAESRTIGGATFQQVVLRDLLEGVPLAFGIHEDLLIVALGQGEVESILARRDQPAPAWLGELRKRFDIPRQSTVSLVRFAELRRALARGLGDDVEPLMRLGLDSIEGWSSASGLDETGFVRRAALDLSGSPRGVLAAFAGGPLTAEDLRPIPADATFGAAVRFDVQKFLEAVVESVDPSAQAPVEAGFEAVEQVLGMKVREEFLASLGSVWTLHTSPRDGGLLGGWTMTVPVKNRGKVQLALALERVRQLATAQSRGRRARSDWTKFQGHDIYSLILPDFAPFAVSYCVTDSHLVLAITPQAIKSYLTSQAGDRAKLSEHPAAAAALKLEPAPMLMGKSDNKRLLEDLYPLSLFAVQAIMQGYPFRDADIKFQTGQLPSLDSLTRHAGDGLLHVQQTDQGFEMVHRQRLPAAGSTTWLLFMLLGTLL